MAQTGRRVALVTGSGRRRVGFHVAAALAERGYAVMLHYRTAAAEASQSAEELKQRYGVPSAVAQADLADAAQVDALVAATREQFGRIDVLVNCAAIWERKGLEETTAEDVRKHFDTNTLGTFLTCRAVGLQMVGQAEGGCIVNIGDWAAVRPYADYAAYFVSKAAIPGLTRVMAVELGQRNPRVRVNAVLPGPVMLPEEMSPQEREEIARATLVRREGSPQHVALAVLHFIDNDFLTGVCLPVDGGRTIFAGGL